MRYLEEYFERRRGQRQIKAELDKARMTERNGFAGNYLDSAITYLDWAIRCGLGGQCVIDSCYDLAKLKDPEFVTVGLSMIDRWSGARNESLATSRDPREIPMQLYPGYFAAILSGAKTYEGRAYDPRSPKEYHDIREGDSIFFSVSRETERWGDECSKLGIDPNRRMAAQVGKVLFAPSVHWMYQFQPCVGEEFQPMVNGPSELLYIQRAAVYYSFPGYRERIREFGFIGIEIESPLLV